MHLTQLAGFVALIFLVLLLDSGCLLIGITGLEILLFVHGVVVVLNGVDTAQISNLTILLLGIVHLVS